MANKANLTKKLSPKQCMEQGLFVCGSAKTVKETLIGYLTVLATEKVTKK